MNIITSSEYKIDSSTEKIVADFLSLKADGKRFAFGRNEHSESLIKNIKMEAVIDDFAQDGTIWKGLPVIKRVMLPNDAIVVNCVTSISPVTVKNLLEQQKIKYFGLYALCQISPEKFEYPDFIKNTKDDFAKNKDRWQKVFDNLEDDISKKYFHNVLQYRLTGDYNFMSNYKVRMNLPAAS